MEFNQHCTTLFSYTQDIHFGQLLRFHLTDVRILRCISCPSLRNHDKPNIHQWWPLIQYLLEKRHVAFSDQFTMLQSVRLPYRGLLLKSWQLWILDHYSAPSSVSVFPQVRICVGPSLLSASALAFPGSLEVSHKKMLKFIHHFSYFSFILPSFSIIHS